MTGTLKFAPGVELTISGSITPATGKLPEGIELTGEGLSAVYNIRGFFIAGTTGPTSGPVIVGTVVAIPGAATAGELVVIQNQEARP